MAQAGKPEENQTEAVAPQAPVKEQPTQDSPQATEDKPAPKSWSEDLLGFPVHGYLSARYIARFAKGGSEESDQDIVETLSLDLGAADRNRVTGHFLGRLSEDIDGRSSRGRSSVFDSITDSYNNSVNGRLYHAYLDVHRLPALEFVRAGRQPIHDTPVFAYLDGGRLETVELWDQKLQVGGYGGSPVHLFESSAEGDVLVGSYLQARPWKGGRARVDWMHARDRTTLGVESNDLFGAALWQNLGESVQLHGNYTFLEDKSRDFTVRGTYQEPEWDFRLQGSYHELLEPQRDLALELDPYFLVLQEHSPFRQTRWLASKGFGEHFVVDGGFDIRRLKDSSDEGTFNREFERYFLTPSVHDLLFKGLSFSVTGELWDSNGRDIASAGADLSCEFNKTLRTSIGTNYSLYKYDYFLDRERDRVQSYYVKFVCKLTEHWRSDLDYQFEDDEFDEYHVLRVGLTLSF